MALGVAETEGPFDRPKGLTKLEGASLICGTSFVMVLADMADGAAIHADVDDRLRAAQIGHLMSGQGSWFDPSLPFIAMPEPYLSPWSRLVDLPYVVLGRFLSLFTTPDRALDLAYFFWPLLMLVAFGCLALFVARKIMVGVLPSRTTEALVLVLMAMLMALATLEFVPRRIDHHNVQLLLLLAMAAGLCRWDARGGLLMGAASAASVVVGLECLPFVVVTFGALAGCYILGANGARTVLLNASIGMGGTTVLSAAAFLGPAGAMSLQCDAFSAQQIVLMLGLSLAIGGACLMGKAPASPVARAFLLAVPALGILALVAVLFPSCLAGPYAIIDPLSRLYWFDRIDQERGLLHLLQRGRYSVAVAFMLIGTALVGLLPMVVAKARAGAAAFLILYILAVASFLLAVLMVRYIRFPAALVPLFIPALVAWYLDPQTGPRSRRALFQGGAAAIAVFAGLFVFSKRADRPFDAVDYMALDACKGEDLSALQAAEPGRIALPNGLAFTVIEAMPAGFQVAAIPFHRAAPGMKRMYEAFLSSDPAVRKAALVPFDYVAVCRFPLESDPSFALLYAALSAGKDWPGLVRIAPPVETRFQLFRIDHAALQ